MALRFAPFIRCVALSQCCSSRPTLSQVSITNKKYSTKTQKEIILESPFSDIKIPDVPITKYIFDAQEQFAGYPALVDGITGQSYTHDEIRTLTFALGSSLTRLDISSVDIVAIILPNCPEFAITFYGVASIGAINTTINFSYTAAEIALQLANSGATAVVTCEAILPKVREACNIYKGARHVIVIGPAEEGLLSFQDLLKDNGKAFPQNVQINPGEDMVVLPYSSGTTGLPKGVMLTHRNLVAMLLQIQHPDCNCHRPNTDYYQEVFVGVLPYFHIYGMVLCLSMSLASGCKSVTLPSFDPKTFISTLEKYKVTYLHTVPPIVNFLTNSDYVTPDLLATTHHMICGGAPVGPALISEFFKKFGNHINFQEGYGLTETSSATHISPKDNYVEGSSGMLLSNTEGKIIDISTGKSLGPEDGEGELCVRGPQVMKGYYRNDEATKDTIDEDGWLHTGDVVRMDQGENIFIVDRLKELIKVKGFQVAPAELENLIRNHPGVADVAVVGVPDVHAGEVPRAYVVPMPGSFVIQQDIADFVERNVAPHKKLSGGVNFINAIPKSSTGKILHRELKAAALA